VTQFGTELQDLFSTGKESAEPGRPEDYRTPEGAPPEGEALESEEPQEPDVSQARSLLTGPHPAGFGEVLVTDVWLPPAPPEKAAPREETASREEGKDEAPVEPQDPQRAWESRQELRQLGLLRERPVVSYDGRTELYWGQVREAQQKAENALVDPYTEFVSAFADADIDGIAVHRKDAREYGRAGEALLEVGRAYVAIGRSKSAQGVLRAAAKADPLHPRVWLYLGLANLFARAHGPAAKALRRSLDQVPGDFLTGLALGVAHYHGKNYAAAEEALRRLAGASGLRAAARSMLACSMRMQENWDDARVELSFLRDAQPEGWNAVAAQCLDCVERGEQKRSGAMRKRRRAGRMWQSLAAAAAGGVWIAYSLSQDLFREKSQWATLPLLLVAVLIMRGLRGISGRELPDEFGNAEQGLPCWQATPWMKHRKSEF
jgi:tetratricopeptide (TPR) repeat protein